MDLGTRKIITHALEKLGITRAAHLWDSEEHSWKSFETKLKCTRGILDEIEELTTMVLETL